MSKRRHSTGRHTKLGVLPKITPMDPPLILSAFTEITFYSNLYQPWTDKLANSSQIDSHTLVILFSVVLRNNQEMVTSDT